jgi:putative SOS response-associated peptidase YedK
MFEAVFRDARLLYCIHWRFYSAFVSQTLEPFLPSTAVGINPLLAKDPEITYRTINASAETVDKAPSFRETFAKRRCPIPADGFYE